MKRVMVRYKVKPEHAAQNENLVRAVYEELHAAQPAGLRYATFKLDDDVTFIHFASNESDNGDSPLSRIAAFKRFQEGLRKRCVEPPTVTELAEIGSFKIFGD